MVYLMINDKGILIKNIYYMLSYAFRVLRQSNYEEIEAEEFENIHDLFTVILTKGIAQQLKQGLYREYKGKCKDHPVMRGRLNIHGTIQNKLHKKQQLTCEYDELSENNTYNRILKTTAFLLLRQPTVRSDRRKALKKVMLFFENIDLIEPSLIRWNTLSFRKNNQNYKMLMNICRFTLEGMLLSDDKGDFKMAEFLDDQQMYHLFEKFVLEFYRYHYPQLQASSENIKWDADGAALEFLPMMKTDITLRNGEKTLIIDTKYYAGTMQKQRGYDRGKIHSANLYQIFAYVKNMDMESSGKVSGVLLYAKTGERITPDYEFEMQGNKISVKTLDLNVGFPEIKSQLNEIVRTFLRAGYSGSM